MTDEKNKIVKFSTVIDIEQHKLFIYEIDRKINELRKHQYELEDQIKKMAHPIILNNEQQMFIDSINRDIDVLLNE